MTKPPSEDEGAFDAVVRQIAASVYYAVHFGGRLLSLLLIRIQHLEGEGTAAEGDGDGVAGLDLFGGFCGFAVDLDAAAGAGFRGDGAALYDPRDFEKFVDPHLFTCCFPRRFRGGERGGGARRDVLRARGAGLPSFPGRAERVGEGGKKLRFPQNRAVRPLDRLAKR